MNQEKYNKIFSLFILFGMAAALALATAFKWGSNSSENILLLVSVFGSLMGACSGIFSANGRIVTFLFGLLDVSIYGIMCFMNWNSGGSGLGTAILHMVYFVPMQFIGFFQWRKRGADSKSAVKARRLSSRQWLFFTVLFVCGAIFSYFLLAHFDKSDSTQLIKMAVVLDVIPLMCNIIGQLLMSTAYLEQWIFWIGVNVFSILMWTKSFYDGQSSFAGIYIVKYFFYLTNCIHGLRLWIKMSKQN